MKKFRMMLPVLAVVFAVAGAIAGDFLPTSQGKYKIGANCSSAVTTDQQCFRSDDAQYPLCTITPSGGTAKQAYDPTTGCSDVLRYSNN